MICFMTLSLTQQEYGVNSTMTSLSDENLEMFVRFLVMNKTKSNCLRARGLDERRFQLPI